jgi:hypothetical protein
MPEVLSARQRSSTVAAFLAPDRAAGITGRDDERDRWASCSDDLDQSAEQKEASSWTSR